MNEKIQLNKTKFTITGRKHYQNHHFTAIASGKQLLKLNQNIKGDLD